MYCSFSREGGVRDNEQYSILNNISTDVRSRSGNGLHYDQLTDSCDRLKSCDGLLNQTYQL